MILIFLSEFITWNMIETSSNMMEMSSDGLTTMMGLHISPFEFDSEQISLDSIPTDLSETFNSTDCSLEFPEIYNNKDMYWGPISIEDSDRIWDWETLDLHSLNSDSDAFSCNSFVFIPDDQYANPSKEKIPYQNSYSASDDILKMTMC